MISSSRHLTSATADPRLVELVDVITSRLQAGESVDFESYAAEFPEYADHLQRWIAAMKAMLQLGESFEATDAAGPPANVTETHLAGRLGDFQIVREIARGGMGVVYEAQQISLRRRVALRVCATIGAGTCPRRHSTRALPRLAPQASIVGVAPFIAQKCATSKLARRASVNNPG